MDYPLLSHIELESRRSDGGASSLHHQETPFRISGRPPWRNIAELWLFEAHIRYMHQSQMPLRRPPGRQLVALGSIEAATTTV
jgi:hypothetical protein